MFHVQTTKKVAGPDLGPIFGQKSDFFGVVPGVFPGGLGIVEWCSRAGLGVFRATCFRLFSDLFMEVSRYVSSTPE